MGEQVKAITKLERIHLFLKFFLFCSKLPTRSLEGCSVSPTMQQLPQITLMQEQSSHTIYKFCRWFYSPVSDALRIQCAVLLSGLNFWGKHSTPTKLKVEGLGWKECLLLSSDKPFLLQPQHLRTTGKQKKTTVSYIHSCTIMHNLALSWEPPTSTSSWGMACCKDVPTKDDEFNFVKVFWRAKDCETCSNTTHVDRMAHVHT